MKTTIKIPFAKATKFVIDETYESGVVKRKKYKTKVGFLNRIKVLGVKNLDTVKVQKSSTHFSKGVQYSFIWE